MSDALQRSASRGQSWNERRVGNAVAKVIEIRAQSGFVSTGFRELQMQLVDMVPEVIGRCRRGEW